MLCFYARSRVLSHFLSALPRAVLDAASPLAKSILLRNLVLLGGWVRSSVENSNEVAHAVDLRHFFRNVVQVSDGI
jgi:hypothetical protein